MLDGFNRVRYRGTPEVFGGLAEREQHDGTVTRGEASLKVGPVRRRSAGGGEVRPAA